MFSIFTLYNFAGITFCFLTLFVTFCIFALAKGELAKKARTVMFVAAGMLFQPIISTPILDGISVSRGSKMDYYLYRVDEIITGCHPSFTVGMLRAKSAIVFWSTGFAYNFIGGMLLIVVILYVFCRPFREFIEVLQVGMLNIFLALPIYFLCPACGPKYAFENFPKLPSHVPLAGAVLNGPPPNCVPSVHVSTSLVIATFLWRWKFGRVLGPIFVLLTVLATIGTGEHYLFDVLVAIPYTMLVFKASNLITALVSRRKSLQLIAETN